MATPTYGYIDRPDYYTDGLFESVGYVSELRVEQEGDHDEIVFTLVIYYETYGDRVMGAAGSGVVEQVLGAQAAAGPLQDRTAPAEIQDLRAGRVTLWQREQRLRIFLDKNTTVAFAQLQLLRDALGGYGTKEPAFVRVHFSFADTTLGDGYVYYVRLIQDPGTAFPVTMQDYYDDAITWFVHLD